MLALTSLTLKQLASGVVVREDLAIKDLPSPPKRELEALAMLPGNYTIIGESKELGKCEGGNLTKNEVVRVTRSLKKRWRNWALMGAVGHRIKVTVRSAGTGSGAEKQKHFVVEKMGEDEEVEAENVFPLTKKLIEDSEVQKGGRNQTFVNNGSLNSEFHVPSGAGKAALLWKFYMFINQKRELVMLSEARREGFVWSSKTTAQRD